MDKKDDMQSPENRQNWVRFEDEDSKVPPTTKQPTDNSDAAVLPVENGPHSNALPTGKGIPESESYDGAVIDTTQIHVSYEKKQKASEPPPKPAPPRPSAPHPTPAPRSVHRSISTPATQLPPSTHPPRSIPVPMGAPPVAVTPAARATQNSSNLQNIPLQETTANGTVPLVHRDSMPLRQGFANGDVIVTLLPMNEKCPWLTRAEFRPELVPEELMAEGLTLTVEEYVSAMEILVNDFRFNCYNMCYKRILLFWILFGFFVLLALLFSGVRGLTLFAAGVIWLLLNAAGIFICMWLKIRMSHHLEKCLASVNKYFLKHKILLGLDDRGKLSCHKVNLIFIYFDTSDCIRKLNEIIDSCEKGPKENQGAQTRYAEDFQSRMDIDDKDIIITGSTNTHLSRRQERAEKLLLRYSQRWVKEFVRHRLDLSVDIHDRGEGEPPAQPRHCGVARCPCQFIEEHLKFKPKGKFCGCQLFDF